jgi:GntR family transcriptional regulator
MKEQPVLQPVLRLQPGSPLPLHAQVQQLLRELCRLPKYQQGALLPDEVTLASRLGISRGTVRSGVAKLVQEGLLERKAGVGTRVVTRQHCESGVTAWHSLTREMATKGITVQTFDQELGTTAATAEVAQALRIKAGVQVKRLDRLRGWGGIPVLHSRSWFHPRLGLTGKEVFDQPLYEVLLAETGAVVHHAREEFRAVAASTEMARRLRVTKGTPLLLRRHTVFDPGSRPIELCEVHYRSDRFTLTLDLRREEE